MKLIDLFAGCGGLSLGFQQAGYEVVGFVEWWKPAIATFLKNKPQAKLIGRDIRHVSDETLLKYKGEVEIIVGGPPCQGFSLCGKRRTTDERNQLYQEFIRFVKIIQPSTVVMENVPGLLSMPDKDKEPIINKILRDFIRLDYFVSYKVLSASDFGVPQHRQRLFIIARRMKLFPTAKRPHVSVAEAINDIPNKENACNAHLFFSPQQQTIERMKSLKQGEKLSQKYNFCRQRLRGDEPSRTVTTSPMFIHPVHDRFLSPRELARLQSFPDSFLFTGSKTAMVKQVGNAVPPKLAHAIAKQILEAEKHA